MKHPQDPHLRHSPGHSFSLTIRDGEAPFGKEENTCRATVTLTDMTGMTLPWALIQSALESMLPDSDPHNLYGAFSNEEITAAAPETGERSRRAIALAFRPEPTGPMTSPDGVRTHRGTLEARRTPIGAPGHDTSPEAQPLTRIWTAIAAETGRAPAYADVIESPGSRRHHIETWCASLAEGYGLTALPSRSTARLQLGATDLRWDLDHGMFQDDHHLHARHTMRQYLYAADCEIERRQRAPGA